RKSGKSYLHKYLQEKEIVTMAYIITDECIACGSCEDECPLEAISEGEDKYVIDPKVCNDCGACADQCPVEAIIPGEDK
ncbi:MAG: 4Fe-4S binding protein, partial [Syntrophus sp. (in: bacteria)]